MGFFQAFEKLFRDSIFQGFSYRRDTVQSKFWFRCFRVPVRLMSVFFPLHLRRKAGKNFLTLDSFLIKTLRLFFLIKKLISLGSLFRLSKFGNLKGNKEPKDIRGRQLLKLIESMFRKCAKSKIFVVNASNKISRV